MPRRPRIVTYAAWLLCALAALPVAFVLIAVVLRDDLEKAAGPAGAENLIRAGQATCWYSWRSPPRRSSRWMRSCVMAVGSVIGLGSGRSV